MDELDRGAEIRVPRLVGFVLKFIAPVYLAVIFIAFIVGEVKKGSASYFAKVVNDDTGVVPMSVGFIALVLVFFVLVIAQSVKRWRAVELGRPVRCLACGYDLRFCHTTSCPDCSAVVSGDAETQARPRETSR